MSLPAPNLDDLRFQSDIVDEARKRITQYCPEWTDYNLSDPGVTLIELFAWMTEMMVYRLNQVPEKNYLKFLEMLGMQREPASSAVANLTFWLSVSLPISEENQEPVVVPEGTQVASRNPDEDGEIIFSTERKLVVRSPKLTQLRREEDFHKNYLPRLGIDNFYAFNATKPQEGDTFYLGFDDSENICGHIMRLNFQARRTEAVGIRREDPPWIWECSMGDGVWQEVAPSTRAGEKDSTGGLNNPQGNLVLYLPMEMKPDQVFGRSAFWIRCRFEQRRPEQGRYSESPRIFSVTAQSLGATVPAVNAIRVENEFLGTSNGEPGQSFHLEYAPLLSLRDDEIIEVEAFRNGEVVYVPWKLVSDFSQSTHHDRHFMVDTANGEVIFGPAVRQQNGSVKQYGRIPETGRNIRFKRYRYGGGARGNVPADNLQSLTTSLAYISRVTNLTRASGGMDPENLEEIKVRSRKELQTQLRAVTAEDYEQLAKKASRRVARAKCNTPGKSGVAPGVVEILLVPAVADSLHHGDLSKLVVDKELSRTVTGYLDKFRMLTTSVQIKEPSYLGVKVTASIVPMEFSQPEIVQANVIEALKSFINPLPLYSPEDDPLGLVPENWHGWSFGRNLYLAELFSLIQRVPGVKHVLDIQVYTREVNPGEEQRLSELPFDVVDDAPQQDDQLRPVEDKLVRITPDMLLCSLQHEVVLTDLDESGA